MKKTVIITAAFFLICLSLLCSASSSSAKTKKRTLYMTGQTIMYEYPKALQTAKKVRVKSSNKAVIKAVYQKKKKKEMRRIYCKAKKTGTAIVTVTCKLANKKTKSYRYRIKVLYSKKSTALSRAKQAFAIQNQYRKAKNVKALEWSDELYQFCRYRLKTSGFDKHVNLERDKNSYFGNFAKYKSIFFAENLTSGSSNAEVAMKSWKKSSGHYHNLLSEEHVCGAIACYKSIWVAIFYDGAKSDFDNWRDYNIKELTVKRLDNKTGNFLTGSSVAFYDAGDHWGSLQLVSITKEEGKKIYLEVGKTYVFYEQTTPDGYEKAEKMEITVTEDGVDEVVLSS